MGLKVRLTPRAIADLDDIRAYLTKRNPRGAERVRLHYDRRAGLERLWGEIVAENSTRNSAEVPPSLIRFSDDHPRDSIAQVDR